MTTQRESGRVKFPEQAKKLRDLIMASGMNPDDKESIVEIARWAILEPKTVYKYVRGYGKGSDRAMEALERALTTHKPLGNRTGGIAGKNLHNRAVIHSASVSEDGGYGSTETEIFDFLTRKYGRDEFLELMRHALEDEHLGPAARDKAVDLISRRLKKTKPSVKQ